MDLSARVLGKSTATQLQERVVLPILRIGSDQFTRADLAAVECFNFMAAANLSKILNHELTVKNTKDVFENLNPFALALPRLGVISLAVLGAAFEKKGLGGEHPLETWIRQHHDPETDGARDLITFDTIKARQPVDTEAKDRAMRKHARRNQAHELRVGRHKRRQN